MAGEEGDKVHPLDDIGVAAAILVMVGVLYGNDLAEFGAKISRVLGSTARVLVRR